MGGPIVGDFPFLGDITATDGIMTHTAEKIKHALIKLHREWKKIVAVLRYLDNVI